MTASIVKGRRATAPAKAQPATEVHGVHRVVLKLDAVQVHAIRHALLVGLESFGEIERLCAARDTLHLMKQPIPDDLLPLHPTGADDAIGGFAAALRYLEQTEAASG